MSNSSRRVFIRRLRRLHRQNSWPSPFHRIWVICGLIFVILLIAGSLCAAGRAAQPEKPQSSKDTNSALPAAAVFATANPDTDLRLRPFGGEGGPRPALSPAGAGRVRGLPSYLNTAPSVNYVGSKACARCHADIYDEYSRTAMGRSMALSGDPALPEPQKPVKFHDYRFNRDYEAFRQGLSLYQSESALGPDGSKTFRDTRRIAYAIGAGENGIGYLVEQGDYLFEAPLSYYARTHTWELSPGYELGDYGFDRVAAAQCLACHSGRPEPAPDRKGLYKDPPFEQLAIGCENCHGPGQLHVEDRMKGEPLEGTLDRSVVNPADLPGWLANNICMACHEAGDVRVLEPGKTVLDFRPGAPLDDTVAIFAVPFTRQSPPQSPLLQQYMQMVLSKCYLGSGGRMTCITCHDPHFEPTAAEAPGYYRKKCLACHTEQSCPVPVAARLRQSPPDNCVGCHMPRQSLPTISHSALTNHRIIAYSSEPFPNAAFHMTTPRLPDLVHLDPVPGDEGKVVAPIVLLQAYGDLMQIHREYRASENRVLDSLAKTQPRNPLVLSALGQRAELAETPEGFAEAQEDLREAIAAGSTKASDLDLYGRLLIHSGDMAEAARVLKEDITLNPYSSERYKMLALAYIKLRDYRLALQTMKQELRYFPQDSELRALVARVQASFSSSPN
jgi:hypothetical protein